MRTTITEIVAVASLLLPVKGPAQSAVPWSTISMGCAVSSSPTTILTSVVGQSPIGLMQGTNSLIESGFLADTLFRTVMVSASEPGEIPTEYALQQNYPNPFNPSTTIKYELPKSSMVRLSVYDMLGREVSVLVNEGKNAGSYEVKFSAAGLSSGVYCYRLQAGDFVQTKKLMLLK